MPTKIPCGLWKFGKDPPALPGVSCNTPSASAALRPWPKVQTPEPPLVPAKGAAVARSEDGAVKNRSHRMNHIPSGKRTKSY